MSAEYAEYLAANVLNEQQLVRLFFSSTMSAESNTFLGQLPLAEQSIESTRKSGKAVRFHAQYTHRTKTKRSIGCCSTSTRNKTQRSPAACTLPTSSLELACRQNRNSRTTQSHKTAKMQSCKAARPYRTVLLHKLPKKMSSLPPYDPYSL